MSVEGFFFLMDVRGVEENELIFVYWVYIEDLVLGGLWFVCHDS